MRSARSWSELMMNPVKTIPQKGRSAECKGASKLELKLSYTGHKSHAGRQES
jgi:hypothetical protein